MARRAAKVDANQARIVKALRDVGASVTSLAAVGSGVPDLLVGFRRNTYIFECKDGDKPPSQQRLTDDQVVWHRDWRGGTLKVVRSVEEALFYIGAGPCPETIK